MDETLHAVARRAEVGAAPRVVQHVVLGLVPPLPGGLHQLVLRVNVVEVRVVGNQRLYFTGFIFTARY